MLTIHVCRWLLVITNLTGLVPDVYAQDPGITFEDQAVILAVVVNGLAGDMGAVFLQDKSGNLFAPESFLASWNLKSGLSAVLPVATGSVREPVRYYNLTTLTGLSYEWDHEGAVLNIIAGADAFQSNTINIGSGAVSVAAPYTTGASVTYDLSAYRTDDESSSSGHFDMALFRGYGLITSDFIADNTGVTRLLSAWQTDKIDTIKTLRIGDSFNHTGTWGRGVLFGGVQYGTNFSVRPDFVSFATPGVAGKTLLPSTVDIYVNRLLRSSQTIDAGPFSLQNLPVITGSGEIELVIRDELGREQLITQTFYASPVLLRKGLVDKAYEFGWQRENYGLNSNDYDKPFATATWRQGLSNRITGEGRIELQRQTATAGVSIAAKVAGENSVVESSLAFSSANGVSTGILAGIGYGYQGSRWSINARMQLNNTDFRQLGSDPARLPKQFATAQLNRSLWDGTLSINYLRNLIQGESMSRLVSINYSKTISRSLFINFSLVKPLSVMDHSGTLASFGLTLLFDNVHTASSRADRQQGNTQLYADIQRSAPQDEGFGYRLAVQKSQQDWREEASFIHNHSITSLHADVVHQDKQVSTRIGAQGGLAMLGSGIFMSRALENGFAVVQTQNIQGIPVYVENQLVGHTNRKGRLVVNRLRPYEKNHVRIDAASLPLESTVGDIEQIVVPRSRGGLVVDFAVHKMRSVILTLLQEDGTPLPAWTPVYVSGIEKSFITGARGEVFIDLPELVGNRVTARPEGNPACELIVDQPAPGVIAPYLKPQKCLSIK